MSHFTFFGEAERSKKGKAKKSFKSKEFFEDDEMKWVKVLNHFLSDSNLFCLCFWFDIELEYWELICRIGRRQYLHKLLIVGPMSRRRRGIIYSWGVVENDSLSTSTKIGLICYLILVIFSFLNMIVLKYRWTIYVPKNVNGRRM